MIKPPTKEQYNQMKDFNNDELEEIEFAGWEWLNSAGEIRVENYLQKTIAVKTIDDDQEGYIKMATGEVINNPYGIRIFAKEYPPKLKHYPKTKFSKKVGYGEIRERWRRVIYDGLKDIEKIGYTPAPGRTVVVYKYHFRQLADPDNFNIMFCNDILRDSWLLIDDNYEELLTIMCGLFDPDNPGTEIILMPEKEFLKHPEIILP